MRSRSFLVFFALAASGLLACGGSDSSSGSGSNGGASSGGSSTFAPSSDAATTGGNPGTTVGSSTTAPAASTGSGGSAGVVTYGQPYQGGVFNLGPVDYAETAFHNACAPATKYSQQVQSLEGNLLAGLWDGIPNVAQYCDACIYVQTAMGKTAVLRVVTYGDTSMNSIDVSPEAYQILNSNEYPRNMTWQFAECPDTGPMVYEFQTGSSEYWTSFWLRNARVPLTGVEVQSANHASYTMLDRGSDGTLTDNSGFGVGMFSIRATGVDGQQVVDTFAWPANGIAGATLTGQGNFH